ncbi:MAG: ribonuclease PH [Chloroflexi bacterium]|nr:ribonuclease PH [Chloroflexota bacterium]
MSRPDGREPTVLRPVRLVPGYLPLHPANCLIQMGQTWVLCAASVRDQVPPFLLGQGQGWVTAEYGMLPASSRERIARERQASGRTQEISRLIGRSLRAAVALPLLGERTITVDCDVLQADGGTRTAAITGGYVALALALHQLVAQALVPPEVLRRAVAAVSVGIVEGEPRLDLPYAEDARAELDMNVVMSDAGELVEVQATAEGAPCTREQLDSLLDLAARGIAELLQAQRDALTAAVPRASSDVSPG